MMPRILAGMFLLAIAAPSIAQVNDHLKCYKVKNTTLYQGAVDLLTADGLEANCKIRIKPVLYCTPATKFVKNTGGSPTLPVSGPPLPNDFICYKIACPPPFPPDRVRNDQFGPHTLAKLTPKIVCAPAAPVTSTTTSTTTTTTISPCNVTTCANPGLSWGSLCQIPGYSGCVDPDGGGPLQLGDGQFLYPLGSAIDWNGNFYVVEYANNRVQKFNATGQFLTKWGSPGAGNGQFYPARGIAVDQAGDVFVTDADRVQKFDTNGNFLLTWGTNGTGMGQFQVPWGIASTAAGDVYVADRGNHRIQRFDANGNFVLTWGSYGSGNGQFDTPNAVAVGPTGDVFVADSGNNRVQKFDANGNFLLAWGSYGTGNGQFMVPPGIAVDGCSNVYVADAAGSYLYVKVQRFDANGTYVETIGGYGIAPGLFWAPDLISADPVAPRFFLADTIQNDVQQFLCN
jgi:NHL repeat